MSERRSPALNIVRWPAGTPLWRIHHEKHANALWFGPAPGAPARHRYDAPDSQYRICYLGDTPDAAFVESLLRGAPQRLVARSDLRVRRLAQIEVRRPLRLARLDGPGLVALGTGGHVVHSADYTESQKLALAAFEDKREMDGVRYRSRWDDDCYCVGLFDRAVAAVQAVSRPEPLDQSDRIRRLLDKYQVGVL